MRHPKNLLTRFAADQRGQAILFAAASIMVLAGFVALVFNIGQVTERRARVQLAADNAAYSGALVQANGLSSIAWINNGMAQIYTNLTRYAVDVCTTGVVAELEHRLNRGGLGVSDYQAAITNAQTWLPRGKEWMTDLSRIENAVAIVTPRLMQETMYNVAKVDGAERVTLYPTPRLFPAGSSEQHFLIEQFAQGWRVTNLVNNDMFWIFKQGNEWHLIHNNASGVTQEEVVVREVIPGKQWVVIRYDDKGNVVQQVTLYCDDQLGWLAQGWNPGQPPGQQTVQLAFKQVDMDGDGKLEGTQVTDQQGNVQVFKRENGILYLWRPGQKDYAPMTTQTTTVGGVEVRVNVTNSIAFPGANVNIGQPTSVHVGNVHIVLSDPPVIEGILGPVVVRIQGFSPGSFSFSVAGYAMSPNSADGRWRKRFDPVEQIWWRQRLIPQTPNDPTAIHQWQYDYERMGTHLRYEPNMERFTLINGLYAQQGGPQQPDWMKWYDVITGKPYITGAIQNMNPTVDPVTKLHLPTSDPPDNAYYLTVMCSVCNGTGYAPDPQTGQMAECAACHAEDHDRNGKSDLRVSIQDVRSSRFLLSLRGGDPEPYVAVRVFEDSSYGAKTLAPRRPLVLSDEFFKYGVNVAVWRGPEASPMLFNREPNWGFVAVSSARIGIPEGAGYVYKIDPGAGDAEGRDGRQQWSDDAPENLYRPSLEVKLVSSKKQVDLYDLEHEGNVIDETGVTYLWDVLMFGRYTSFDEVGMWLSEYNGRTDRTVPGRLRNMHDRANHVFDVRSHQLDDVIYH
jgi:Flp pilus assembly protein TadG